MAAAANKISANPLLVGARSAPPSIWRLARFAALVAPIVLAGCGDSGGLEKVVVQGSVSLDGKPINYGKILFYPIEGTAGPVSGALIRDGRYEATGKGGVPVGTHRVQIQGFRPGRPTAAPQDSKLAAIPGGLEGPAEQYVPKNFNRESTLVVAVEPSRKPITQDFHLEP